MPFFNSMRKFCVILILLLAVLPVEAKKTRKGQKSKTTAQISSTEARRLTYFYQEGVKQKLANNLSEAYDLFQHCLDIDPNNPEAMFELGYLKFYLGQDSLGTAMLQRVAELDSNNPRYIQSLAAAYLARNQYDKAIPVVEHLSQLQTRRSDVLYQLVELYKTNGQTDEAINALDRIELLEGRTLQSSLQKYAFYVDKGEQDKAYEVLASLAKESPYDLRIPIILGQRYLDNGDYEKALECFHSVEKTDPQNADLRLAMMDYYMQTGQQEKRDGIRDSLLFAEGTSDELRGQMMALLIEDKKNEPGHHERILETFDSLIHITPSPLIYSLRTSYLLYTEASPDVVAQSLRDLLKVDSSNENALSRLLVYYIEQKDYENIAEICRMGINAYPESLIYYFYLGVSLLQTEQSASAIETLQNGLKQSDGQQNPDYISDIYELLGELYYEQGRVSDAFAAYDSCLVYRDDNVSCLNNYAYYLSLRNERLDEAERMSYRAIKMEPLNKTYLDTYAWVLFVQGNYSLAKFYIDRVVSPQQTDSLLLADENLQADVFEHAGDIYAMNDNEELAVRYWTLARRKGSGGAILEKKVKLRKYVKE